MKLPEPSQQPFDEKEWAKRKSANTRLGILVGLIVVLIFLGSIWKYRPL
jgi:hypothetical protein